jgi:arylsulfatase A-like enzyme
MRPVSAACVACLISLLVTPPASVAAQESRPNVLVIMTDDQRFTAEGYQLMPRLMTRVREGGIWFRNAVSTTPLCCPSRVSTFTGQYAHNHKITGNGGQAFKSRTTTIQYQLRQAGYRTAFIGKFLSNNWTTNPPHFDRWALMSVWGYYDATFNVNGVTRRPATYSTTYMKDRALEYLDFFERSDAAPWLMFVHPWAPHKPATPETKYASASVPAFVENPATQEADRSDKPAYVQNLSPSKTTVLKLRTNMLRSLKSVDDMAAAIFARLDALGETNTMIFFMSDNGFEWFEHRLHLKRFPYNESVRIPMFVSWPGHVPAGAVRDNIVGNIDVAATIYEAAGVSPSYAVDGRPMFSSNRDRILTEYWHESFGGAPPTWRWSWTPESTYVEYPEIGVREFYADDDPWQLNNVFGNRITGDEPQNTAELSARLASDAVYVGSSCP